MGENLEYCIENKIIETLVVYAMIDQPQGFFKFLLGAVEDLVSTLPAKQLLSHASVNQPIRLLLKTIYDKLIEIPYVSADGDLARSPDEEFVMSQRPRIIFYTADVLKFLATLINKVT